MAMDHVSLLDYPHHLPLHIHILCDALVLHFLFDGCILDVLHIIFALLC